MIRFTEVKNLTPVQWLYNKLIITPINEQKWNEVLEKALSMEESDIVAAFDNGMYANKNQEDTDGVEYFNQTYNL